MGEVLALTNSGTTDTGYILTLSLTLRLKTTAGALQKRPPSHANYYSLHNQSASLLMTLQAEKSYGRFVAVI